MTTSMFSGRTRVHALLSTPLSALPCPAIAAGWILRARFGKAVGFLDLSDGSSPTPLQVVLPTALLDAMPELRALGPGCAVLVRGELVSSRGAGQALEFQAHAATVLGGVEDPRTYPIQPRADADDFLRTVPHLRHRVPAQASITRLRHHLASAIHDYLSTQECMWVPTPILTSDDAEGAGARFEVQADRPFFDRPAHLTVSGQLSAEALAMGMERVYTFGPTFRAERSHTSRHLAEFWMVEPELAFADLDVAMDLAEGLVRHGHAALASHSAEYAAMGTAPPTLPESPFVRLTYTQTIEQSREEGLDAVWGKDLSSDQEQALVARHDGPVFVTHWPTDIKAFYMRAAPDGRPVAAFDLLVPGLGELAGGSEREDDLDRLVARMHACGMDPSMYGQYLDLRRYGSVPHAGFGVGFERLLAWCTGQSSVRDVVPFPRAFGVMA